jgi:O-antigen ligase
VAPKTIITDPTTTDTIIATTPDKKPEASQSPAGFYLKVLQCLFKAGMELGLYVSLFFLFHFVSLPLFYQGFGPAITLIFWLLLMLVSSSFPYTHYSWNVTILLLNAWAWFSCFWSVKPDQTIAYCVVVSGASLLIIALSSSLHSKGFKIRMLLAFVIFGLALAFSSVSSELQELVKIIKTDFFTPEILLFRTAELSRITGPMGGPNTIGGVMGLLIPFLLAFTFYGFPLRKSYRWFHNLFNFLLTFSSLLLALAFFVVLVLSFSRGAFLGLLAGIIVLWMLPRHWMINLHFLILLLMFYLVPDVKSEAQRFYEGVVDEDRFIIFQNSGELARLVPFSGVGLGAFVVAYQAYFNEPFIHAHNLYLNVLVELGIPGVVLTVLLSWQFLSLGISLARKTSDPFNFAFKAGMLALLSSLLARCLIDFTL